MNEPEIYATLQKIFEDVFNDDLIAVTPELSANEVESWDSITNIRLMLTVERAFKMKLSALEIGKFENVGDLVTLIKART
jgi:acyl carrier protein